MQTHARHSASVRGEIRDRAQKRRMVVLKRRLAIAGSAFAVIIAALAFLSRLPGMRIQEIAVSGERLVPESSVAAFADEAMSGAHALLFSRRNALIYPKRSMEAGLMAAFPRIETVSADVADDRTLIIAIDERESSYIWCASLPSEHDAGVPCYFLDDAGIAFADAPYFSGPVYFTFYAADAPGEGVIGTAPLAAPVFGKLLAIRETLEHAGVSVQSIAIDDGLYEFHIKSSRSVPPKILVAESDDPERALGNLVSALDSEPLRAEHARGFAGIEYMDLRFDNRVVYKFIDTGL